MTQTESQPSPRLEAVGLMCIRDDRVLFDDLGFSLGPGEMIQVEGPNGSGKTTLLRILCGLTLPGEGEVRWCGEDIQRARGTYLAELSYFGHAHGVKIELTALENLRMACALGTVDDRISLEDALARVGMVGYEDVACRSLSAGQQRRVALARLLVTRTRLWVLDEPFTAIDRAGRASIEAMLQEHLAEGGMVVLTSHHTVNLPAGTRRHIHLGQ